MDLVVDIADLVVTSDRDATLVTHSLGSCIGVSVWDPEVGVGGMIHYMLPDASIARDKAEKNPAMFATTGVPNLFREAFRLGAKKDRLVVKVAGGSQLFDDKGLFNIGRKNYIALRKLLFKNGIEILAEDVGGSLSRTFRLYVGSGRVTIRSGSEERDL